MSNQFKISHFSIDDPQEVQLLYGDFKESEKFPGTYSIKVLHKGIECYWNVSGMVKEAIEKLGVKKNDTIIATRREGKNGKSFTEVTVPGDITVQDQNKDLLKIKDQKKQVTNQEYQDKRERIIIIQSLLHINGYYQPEKSFADNLDRAIKHADYFIQKLSE